MVRLDELETTCCKGGETSDVTLGEVRLAEVFGRLPRPPFVWLTALEGKVDMPSGPPGNAARKAAREIGNCWKDALKRDFGDRTSRK